MLRRNLLLIGVLLCALAARATVWHTVQAGETLAGISQRYRIDTRKLIAANHLDHPNLLAVGQRLAIPDLIEFHARRGDTLPDIARVLDVPVDDLARLNKLPANSRLTTGQRLILPASEPAVENIAVTPAQLVDGWDVVSGTAEITVSARNASRVEFWCAPAGGTAKPCLLGLAWRWKDGWCRAWTVPAHTSWHLWAVAVTPLGLRASSALLDISAK